MLDRLAPRRYVSDREEVFTAAAGPVYFRLFIAARSIDEAWIDGLAERICWLYCTARD